MIAKISKGGGFSGVFGHAAKGPLLESNVGSTDPQEIARQMRRVADSAARQTGKPVYHISLRPSAADWDSGKLAEADLRDIARAWCNKMGFDLDTHQFAMYSHDAYTDHGHVHVILNKIAIDGSHLDDKNDFQRAKKACREIEIERGLTIVNNKKEAPDAPNLTRGELEKAKRTGQIPPRQRIKIAIDKRIVACSTLPDLAARLEADEVKMEILSNKSGPYGVRFSARDETGKTINFTGQQISKNCTLKKLLSRLAPDVPAVQARQTGMPPHRTRAAVARIKAIIDQEISYNDDCWTIDHLRRRLGRDNITMTVRQKKQGYVTIEYSVAVTGEDGKTHTITVAGGRVPKSLEFGPLCGQLLARNEVKRARGIKPRDRKAGPAGESGSGRVPKSLPRRAIGSVLAGLAGVGKAEEEEKTTVTVTEEHSMHAPGMR